MKKRYAFFDLVDLASHRHVHTLTIKWMCYLKQQKQERLKHVLQYFVFLPWIFLKADFLKSCKLFLFCKYLILLCYGINPLKRHLKHLNIYHSLENSDSMVSHWNVSFHTQINGLRLNY